MSRKRVSVNNPVNEKNSEKLKNLSNVANNVEKKIN